MRSWNHLLPWLYRDAKPIQTLSLIWDGADGINIVTAGDQVINGINNGDLVVIVVADLGNDVDVTISGAASGVSRFHVSCSDQEMNGPEDCGSSLGNSKDNDAGLINSWIFKGMAGNSLTLDCTP